MHSRFFHRAQVNCNLETAWSVFTEHERMGEYTSTNCHLKVKGSPDPNGLGAVRVLEESGWQVEEIVNYWVPLKLFGYHVIAGPPLKLHQGAVRFYPIGPHRTEWVYDMKLVATDEVLQQLPDFYARMQGGFPSYMHDLECECERRASAYDVPFAPIPVENPGRMDAAALSGVRKAV